MRFEERVGHRIRKSLFMFMDTEAARPSIIHAAVASCPSAFRPKAPDVAQAAAATIRNAPALLGASAAE